MARYTIEDTTLTALGDAVRAHVGETKPAIVEAIYDFTATGNNTANNNDWVSRAYNFALRVPGASQVIVKNIVITTNTSPEEITFKVGYGMEGRYNSLPGPIYIYGSPDTPSEITSAASKVNGGLFFVSVRCPIEYTDITISLTATGLDAEGNILINKEIEVPYLMTPDKMIEELNNIQALPPEALEVKGYCSYRFYNGVNNWVMELYGDKIICDNITSAESMFQNNPIDDIPFTLNFAKDTGANQVFYQCNNLKMPPKTNGELKGGQNMFYYCRNLESLNGFKFKGFTQGVTVPTQAMFSNCYKLRDIEGCFDNYTDLVKGSSIYGMYEMFYNCYSLDQLINLPFIYITYSSSGYSFGNCFTYCHRLKDITFRGGVVTDTSAKSNSLSLSSGVGYVPSSAVSSFLANTNFTSETRVTDDDTYHSLKNHPDWWTSDVNYSRYNHDSAVNTLNSLPDYSNLSVSNTIKFTGAAGTLTDGGAINTLTEEEIAVATAKGWTVTFV